MNVFAADQALLDLCAAHNLASVNGALRFGPLTPLQMAEIETVLRAETIEKA